MNDGANETKAREEMERRLKEERDREEVRRAELHAALRIGNETQRAMQEAAQREAEGRRRGLG